MKEKEKRKGKREKMKFAGISGGGHVGASINGLLFLSPLPQLLLLLHKKLTHFQAKARDYTHTHTHTCTCALVFTAITSTFTTAETL